MNLPVEKRRQWIRSRRQQRKLTKLARLRRQLLRYSVLCALLVAGGMAFYKIHWTLPTSSSDQSVVIKGNLVASDEQIRRALGITFNNLLFALNPKDLEQRVEKLGVIRCAFVRRYALPSPKLQVDVLEEFPWATLYLNDVDTPQFIIAQSGRLISIHDFPHVYQPALRIYCRDKDSVKLNADDVSHWADWIAYVEKQMQCPVQCIDMHDARDVKIQTDKCILALGSADNSLTNRLVRLASVLEVLSSEHKEPSYVNLALNSNIPVKLAKKSDLSQENNIYQE